MSPCPITKSFSMGNCLHFNCYLLLKKKRLILAEGISEKWRICVLNVKADVSLWCNVSIPDHYLVHTDVVKDWQMCSFHCHLDQPWQNRYGVSYKIFVPALKERWWQIGNDISYNCNHFICFYGKAYMI